MQKMKHPKQEFGNLEKFFGDNYEKNKKTKEN